MMNIVIAGIVSTDGLKRNSRIGMKKKKKNIKSGKKDVKV